MMEQMCEKTTTPIHNTPVSSKSFNLASGKLVHQSETSVNSIQSVGIKVARSEMKYLVLVLVHGRRALVLVLGPMVLLELYSE